MKSKLLFLFLFGMFLVSINLVSADTQTLTMKFIVPAGEDTTPPTFDDMRNFNHPVNTSFSKDFDATDDVGVECFGLNDTSVFNIDCSGTVTNITALNTITIYTLNVSVNDSAGNTAYDDFYINVVEATTQCSSTFNYTKMAASNKRPFIQLCHWRDFR